MVRCKIGEKIFAKYRPIIGDLADRPIKPTAIYWQRNLIDVSKFALSVIYARIGRQEQ